MSQGDGGGKTPVCGADGAGGRCGENRAGGGVDGGRLGREAQRRWKWPRGRSGWMGEPQSESESESESEESVHGEKKLRSVEEVGVADAKKVLGMAAVGSSVRVGFWRRGGEGAGVKAAAGS